jgi:diguanylate cyclase (GGDEF)-like protein
MWEVNSMVLPDIFAKKEDELPDIFADELPDIFAEPAPQEHDPIYGFEEEPPAEEDSRSVWDVTKDTGITALKGAMGVPEAAVGLADIVSGGRAGQFAQKTLGFDPKMAKEILDQFYSVEQKKAFKNVQDAEGFWNVLGTAVQNPSVIAHTAMESLPLMGAGGAVARGIKVAPWIAAAIGEGAVGAGLAAEGTRQETEDGRLTGKQSLMAVASGAGTGAFNLVGGRMAKKFGFEDIDTMIAAGKKSVPSGISKNMAGSAKEIGKRIAKGGISEGVLEELPQSVQEQLWANASLGRPLGEGIDNAAAMGLLTGATMGSGANVISGVSPDFDAIDLSGIQQEPDAPTMGEPEADDIIDEGIPIEEPLEPDDIIAEGIPVGEELLPEPEGLPDIFESEPMGLFQNKENITDHMQKKYSGLYGMDESELPHTEYQAIVDERLTPKALDIILSKDPTKVKQVRAALADLLGDLEETYKYEGQTEGQAKEKYLDSLLTATLSDKHTQGGHGAQAGTVPSGTGIDRRQKSDAPETERRTGERRIDEINRKRVSEMTMEEREIALLTSQKTNLKNKRAHIESEGKELEASLDIDSLKWVNDTFGHDAGDALLKKLGDALQGYDLAYHVSGDEFVLQGTQKEIDAAVVVAKKYLKENPLELGGKSFEPKFSYGTAKTLKEADANMLKVKLAREMEGKRAERGEAPPEAYDWPEAVAQRKAKAEKKEYDKQKKYKESLLKEIDAALKKTKEKFVPTAKEHAAAKKVRIGKTFNVLNNKTSLTAFRKQVEGYKVEAPKPPVVKKAKKDPTVEDNLDLADLGSMDRVIKLKERFPDLQAHARLKLSRQIKEKATGTRGTTGDTKVSDANLKADINRVRNERGMPKAPTVKDNLDKKIDELLNAPLKPGGKTRYNFKTKTEKRDFANGFKKGFEGKPAPKISGVAQKYQDAARRGWEQGRVYSRSQDRRSGSFADTGGYADTSAYAKTVTQAIELPEIVQLAKAIGNGKYPGIVKRIAVQSGKALGVFYAAGKNAAIDLRADLFEDTQLAAKVLSHEVGHYIDYLPDRLMTRGNILGHMASLKGYLKHSLPNAPGAPGPLTDKDRARMKYQAKKLTEAKDREVWIDELIRKESPVTPDDILAIWKSMEDDIDPELHLYVKKLNRAQKKAIVKDAMKGVVGAELQQFAKVVETKTGKKVKQTISDAEVTEMIREKYLEMVNEEIAKRRLFDLDVITDELKALTLAWKPFDPKDDSRVTQYRFSPVELYADAFSVLINQPGMLKSIAPNFYEGFFNYLEMKPEAQEAYLEVQASMNKEPIGRAKEHLENMYKMFRESSLKRQVAEKKKKRAAVSTYDFLMKNLWDRSHAVLKIARSLPDRPIFKKAKLAIQELQHTASPISAYLSDYNRLVLKPLDKSGHTYDELNATAFYKRIAEGDRGDKANPLGIDQQIARRDLALMGEEIWGKEKFKEIEGILKKFRGLREAELYPVLRESGLLKPELMDYIEKNQHHVKWDVAEHFSKVAGTSHGAKIYQQIGTLKEIDHPITATMLQDVSLLRAARINLAKQDVLEMLLATDSAKRAPMRYSKDTGGQVPTHLASDKGLFVIMKDGKPQYYEVDADIAAMFEFDPVQAQQLTEIWRVASQPLREAFVGKNVPWMARNLVRDFTATIKNVPGLRLRHIPRLMYNYIRVMGEVKADVFKRDSSERIRGMRKNYGLPHFRTWSGKDQTFDAEIERMLTEFRVVPKADNQAEGLKKTMYQLWEFADGLGLMSEVWGKVAADRFLDTHKKFKMDKRQRAQITRELAGTPDAKQRSAQYSFLNNIFMFSEMRKAGIRQMITAYKADKAGYIWKTFMINVLPKTAKYLMLAAGGAIPLAIYAASGGDDDEVKNKIKLNAKIWTRIPEHDKMMYDCVPLWMTDEGKAVYLALPKDYEGQIFGTIGYLLGKAVMDDQTTATDTAKEIYKVVEQQKPYSLHALLGVFADWAQYAKGENPEDWKGYKVVPRRVFETGDMTYIKESFPYMARHTWRSLGGGVIYKPGYDNVAQDRKMYEKVLSTPPFNALGTFVRFSDRGLTEEINKRLSNYREEKAAKWLTADQKMKALLDGGLSEKEIKDALITPGVTAKKMKKIIKKRAHTDPYVKALSKADEIETAIIINMISEENK